ncbi:MAG: hypothetical protein PVH41_17875 [Anaerolineae bacterium]|jgi:hypothetical protein
MESTLKEVAVVPDRDLDYRLLTRNGQSLSMAVTGISTRTEISQMRQSALAPGSRRVDEQGRRA